MFRNRTNLRLSCLLAGLLWGAPLPAGTFVSLGLSGMDFNYEEFEQGAVLDEEHGQIAGLRGGLRWQRPGRFVEADLVLHSGWVDYDAGPGVSTRTHERIMDWSARIGLPLAMYPLARIEGYAGLGYRDWRRAVRSTVTAADVYLYGLVEQYQWWYWQLGLRAEHSLDERSRLAIDVRLLRPVATELDVDFHAALDDITVEPRSRTGFRLALQAEHDLDNGVTLWLSPWFEFWELGASSWVELQQGGVPTAPLQIAREPDSETRNAGVSGGLRWSF